MFITIKDTEYELKFGMGFMRKIDKTVTVPMPGAPGMKKEAGLRYKIGGLIDGDLNAVEDILLVANEGKTPKLTKAILDDFIEDESTDIDAFIDQVYDFLRSANVSKRIIREYEEAIDENKTEQ